MAEPTTRVEPIRRRPRRGGLFTVADVRDGVARIINGANIQYDPNPCGTVHATPGACWGEVVDDDPKEFDGVLEGTGVIPAFGLYAGVECYMGGWNDYAAQARTLLDENEALGVEGKLYGWLDGATAVGAAGALADAVGALEDAADVAYPGLPILHMSRSNAETLFGAGILSADREGNLVSGNGTPVVASGAYASDEVWISGDITVFRSEVADREANDFTHNRAMALAERGYGIAVDCNYRSKFTITP